jgi:hypothetical protein
MRAIVSCLALLLTACAADAPVSGMALSENDDLCPRLAAFGRSVPSGQTRSVTLSGEGLLGTQTCERGDAAFNPGGAALCKWWVVNSAREFFGENFRSVVDCLLESRKLVPPDELEYDDSQAGYVHSGHLALMSVASIDKNLAAEVTFNAPEGGRGGAPVHGLRVTFRNHARRQ